MIKKNTFLIIYGRGGHQKQMSELLKHGLYESDDSVNTIVFTDSVKPLTFGNSQTFKFKEFRDKYSNSKTIVLLPYHLLKLIYTTLMVLSQFKIKGVITTGPGIAIIPCFICYLFRKKVVVFESWSKFTQPSITAKILYYFSGLFIVQNKSMLKVFPKAKYWGKL